MNILIIAEELPIRLENREDLSKEINAQVTSAHRLFLLSPSWCEVREDNFEGALDILSNNGIYKKRYYVDPLQIRFEGNCIFTALYSLGIKVIKKEHIDCVLFAEKVEYLPIIELLRKNVDCSIVYRINEHEGVDSIMNSTNMPVAIEALRDCDAILGNYILVKNILEGCQIEKKYYRTFAEYLNGERLSI